MVRPLRVEYPSALYHVMSRGNASQDIFIDDLDRKNFLFVLAEAIKTHNLICHAYCLMDNHYHLSLETPEGNLSRAMQDINAIYTQKFNQKYQRAGHVLQGRYQAHVIEKETYLLEVVRYIVLNPVRAHLVDHPRLWRWSNYNATAGHLKSPDWLENQSTLQLFGRKKMDAQKKYRTFVKEGIGGKSPYDDLEEGIILGSPQFVHEIWEKTNGSEEMKDLPRRDRVVGRPTLEEVFENVKNLEERNDAICLARLRCGYLISEIARYLHLHGSTVGKIARGTYNLK